VLGNHPRPRRHHPPRRRCSGRTERRMDRSPPLHGPGILAACEGQYKGPAPTLKPT